MKSLLLDLLICPRCLPEERPLMCREDERHGEELWAGSLRCGRCQGRYPIENGIALLLPGPKPRRATQSQYETQATLSAYLWSHYADILGDEDASGAYTEWAALLGPGTGIALDAGCAVGRFTFEMSSRVEFAVGIDNSLTFVRAARDLMRRRRARIGLPEEGTLVSQRALDLPEAWQSDKVEFIVGDAQALPFRSTSFTALASLNLLDKVPLPLRHLLEMNRVAREKQAQLLLSDPFSWSPGVAREEDWLGGTSQGPRAGYGMDNLQSLLTGKTGELLPPWKIQGLGHVWWKIRHHRNRFELIRSCFLKALR